MINFLIMLGLLVRSASFASLSSVPTLLLVDKKSNTLKVAKYNEQGYAILKSYHATLGKVKGDKEVESDLKTPEGIYTFNARLAPPHLKPKFGAMAFYMNYPNPFDQIAGRTGYDIMLHGTNEPERLKKDFDSEGCVVVNNYEIKEIQPHIRLGLSPILIFSELTEEYMKPSKEQRLKSFFNSWIKAWESKNIADYIQHYHSDFSAQNKNKSQWKKYKEGLNKKYTKIQISPENILYFRHPKYSMIMFVQNYYSKLNDNQIGHKSRGTKIIYIAEEDDQPKIIAETYTTLMW